MVSLQCLNPSLIVRCSPLDEVVSETFVSLHRLRDPNPTPLYMTHGGEPMGHWQPKDGKYCNFLRIITAEPSGYRRSFLLDVGVQEIYMFHLAIIKAPLICKVEEDIIKE